MCIFICLGHSQFKSKWSQIIVSHTSVHSPKCFSFWTSLLGYSFHWDFKARRSLWILEPCSGVPVHPTVSMFKIPYLLELFLWFLLVHRIKFTLTVGYTCSITGLILLELYCVTPLCSLSCFRNFHFYASVICSHIYLLII